MKSIQKKMYPVLDVFAAACAADRINGGEYVKVGSTVPDPDGHPYSVVPNPKTPNRVLVLTILDSGPAPTAEDVERGSKMITFYGGLTIKLLAGKKLTDYESKALHCATSEGVEWSDFGIIASLPSAWARGIKKQEVQDRISDSNRGWIGEPGVVVSDLAVEVVNCIWSYNWNTNFITALTDDNHCVFFSSKTAAANGSHIILNGRVKEHMPNFQTKLNYVKWRPKA